MSKSIWLIATMGLITMLALALGMGISLGQFQETPAVEWVRVSELIGREFKAEQVATKVDLRNAPSAMIISYSALIDSKFNLSVQNTEMENVAKFAIKNYKGREQTMVDEIRVTRTERHGRGCFAQTYVSHWTIPNPLRRTEQRMGLPAGPQRR
ncbi:MAG: hypothetical protein JO332_14060 [Planctomycetaceae bacterium]|nr:hypothetical protein [Planctomycetaceae bacterium]